MKKILICLFIILNITLYASENRLVKRYAILIGANNGGDSRTILRYAESDAQMISSVFSDIGGIENSDSILLLNPTKSSIIRSFENITNKIKLDNDSTRTELIFYYSGHSTEEGLLIRDNLFSYIDLKQSLKSTSADVQIGILDSCSSGAFTLLKGGKHSAPFLVDESIKTSGHAFITSASENEAAQESNSLQASFFTHFLVSALRGAADTSLDGKVSLHEAYSYASNETLARTEVTQAGAQHAAYDFRLSGSGDLVLTDLRDAESNLNFLNEDFGRFFIRDKEDNLISEVNKKYGSALKISIPVSLYTVIKEVDGTYYKQIINLNRGDSKTLNLLSYKEFTPESNIIRGKKSNQIEYSLNVPKTTAAFGWSTMDKVREAKLDIGLFSKAGALEGMQISLANMVINDVYGAQFALLFNINGGDLSGLQSSALFNISGGNIENYGLQISPLFNWVSKGSDSLTIQTSTLFNHIGSDTEGPVFQTSGIFNEIDGNAHSFTWQTAGLFNNSNNIYGIQLAGLFNISDNIGGLQVSGLFNSASNLFGTQISLVNRADFVYGTQIGLLNINKDIKGLSIGLINISTEGIKNFSYRYDYSNDENIFDYQFGSSTIYNLLSIALPTDVYNIDRISLAAGLGVHIPLGSLYSEVDVSLNNKMNYTDSDGFTYNGSFPLLGVKIALPLWSDTAIFAGVNFELPIIINKDSSLNLNSFTFEDINQSIFFGIRF